jgi:hypothetical protein
MRNVYFDLTEELNAAGRIAILGSGQAVVWHRLAILSKDGDWILRETPAACRRVLEVLERHAAFYRPAAPLDVRWLAGGWSSHLEFRDTRGRRVRCDFFSRPPRLDEAEVAALFADCDAPPVLPIEPLLRMKQTQRAKDYAVIGELARRLPPQRELELTTDPDRIIELVGAGWIARRAAAEAALSGGRRDVVIALAEELDEMQLADRRRLRAYEDAAAPFLAATAGLSRDQLRLPDGHARLVELADRLLPASVDSAPP